MSLPMDMISITVHEWDRVKLGHDRYEWLRKQNLPTAIGIWRDAMMAGARFDDLVDEAIRITGHVDEVRK